MHVLECIGDEKALSANFKLFRHPDSLALRVQLEIRRDAFPDLLLGVEDSVRRRIVVGGKASPGDPAQSTSFVAAEGVTHTTHRQL